MSSHIYQELVINVIFQIVFNSPTDSIHLFLGEPGMAVTLTLIRSIAAGWFYMRRCFGRRRFIRVFFLFLIGVVGSQCVHSLQQIWLKLRIQVLQMYFVCVRWLNIQINKSLNNLLDAAAIDEISTVRQTMMQCEYVLCW